MKRRRCHALLTLAAAAAAAVFGAACDGPRAAEPGRDLGASDLGFPDGGTTLGPRNCDAKVRAGAFASLTNLGAVNSAADESSLALTPDGTRLYFLAGGVLSTAALI